MLRKLFQILTDQKKPQTSKETSLITREKIATLIQQAKEDGMVVNLEGAHLENLDLSGFDLRGAHLARANISHTKLTDTDLAGADLRYVCAEGTAFWGNTRLTGARIYGMQIDDRTSVPLYAFKTKWSSREISPSYLTEKRYRKEDFILGDWYHAQTSKDISDYHRALDVVLMLKNHLPTKGRYIEALQMFYLEKRILRSLVNPVYRMRSNWTQGKKITIWGFLKYSIRWLVSFLADLTCGYGESLPKTLITLLVVQIAFTLGYLLTGSIVDVGGNTVTDIQRTIVFALGAMTTTEISGLQPASMAVEFAMTIHVVVGIALTGLLGFVLGNRIRY